jgi:hypothetical protein
LVPIVLNTSTKCSALNRAMFTIHEEEADLSECDDFHRAYGSIGRILEDVYTSKRIHSAPAYFTPAEFEANWPQRLEQAVLK